MAEDTHEQTVVLRILHRHLNDLTNKLAVRPLTIARQLCQEELLVMDIMDDIEDTGSKLHY